MRVIFGIIFLLAIQGLKAQAPNSFCTTFGGNGIDIGYSVKEVMNQHYVILGSTSSYGSGFPDAYLIMSDSMGQGVWHKNYGGSLSDVGKSLIVNPSDSGFVFVGYSNSFGSGDYDVFVVRTNKHGVLVWQSTFGGTDWDFGNDIAFSSDGNIVVCGNSTNGPNGKKDGLLAKLSIQNGAVIWSKYFGGIEDDEFTNIKLTSDSKLTISGNTKSYGDINGDFWIFKINESGDSLSSKTFGNLNKQEKCYDFMEDSNNDLVFCGSFDTSATNTGKNISYIIKTDLNGAYMSETKISGAYTDDDKFLAITSNKQNDKYFLSRKVNHYGTDYGIDLQPYLMDQNYIFNNATTYGGYGIDEAFDVIATSDNGFLMVGYSKGYGLISEDVYMVKLDATLLNAPIIVGEKENIETSKFVEKIFYSEGYIYFKNSDIENNVYEILNSQGQMVQTGILKGEALKLNQELSSDIYFLKVMNSKNSGIKFIKN